MRDTRSLRLLLATVFLTVLAVLAGSSLAAQSSPAPAKRKSGAPPAAGTATAKPTIVLVHGAFADAMGWQRLIPILL